MNIFRFFRAAYRDNRLRVDASRRLVPDTLRYAINRALMAKERRLTTRYRVPGAPIIFIVGVPRSGTTLLYQLIARYLGLLPFGRFNTWNRRRVSSSVRTWAGAQETPPPTSLVGFGNIMPRTKECTTDLMRSSTYSIGTPSTQSWKRSLVGSAARW